MQQKLNKNIYRGILILSFIAINVFIIYGISSVLAYLKTGASRANMLHIDVKSETIYAPEVTWLSLENPGRAISKQELKNIEDHYLKSWYIKNIAFKNNSPYGIEDFYTDSARVHIYNTLKINKKQQIYVEATTISHSPKLEFYSEDGKLAVLTDKNVVEFQEVYKNNHLILKATDTSSYKVILLLEDGFWRIRHKVKIENDPINNTINTHLPDQIKNSAILVEGKPYIVKGINYYPKETPWDMFGANYNIAIIQKDFKLIKHSGLNSIRIFIQYDDFGKEKVPLEKLKKLKEVLDVAANLELKVVVTLFDFYGDYSILNWTLTHRHAAQIVSTFKNHNAILAWDIKNEPDLDFESRNKETVLAWLSQMIKEVKKFDPNHLVTIGWSSPEAAVHLANEVDFVSYHFYKNIDYFESDYRILKKVTFNKPIVLQEFGLSSYSGVWNLYSGSETNQAEYHQKMQAILKKESLAFMSWGLYDFNQIPTSVAGRLPWRSKKQKYFGFIDAQGIPKPAFSYISY
ncbi:MAG: cellulase family glycosylhydrolase [Flavobacteriaceae bacterium]|nr:cellulase family glycosylhydrolase [Flavobacteriaceae bacterium]